jgi:hypothetical protein
MEEKFSKEMEIMKINQVEKLEMKIWINKKQTIWENITSR